MKMFLILLLLCSIFPSMAQAGGQTGSGMNGCWIKNIYGKLEWRSIEEMIYPGVIRRQSPSSRHYSHITIRMQIDGKFKNVISNYTASKALKRLKIIQHSHPKSYSTFLSLFQLFKHVQVSKLKLKGLFRAETATAQKGCIDYSPAMMTFEDGAIVVFKPIFERLDPFSVVLLYIHETIRFAQVFHPAFNDLSDSDLQYLTSLFFTNRVRQRNLERILNKYEERLTAGCYKIGPPPGPLFNEDYDTEQAFKAKVQEALFNDEENLGTILNDFRMYDKKFRLHSTQRTQKFLQSATKKPFFSISL